MTKMEMLEKLRKLAKLEPVTPGIEDIVIRIYMENDDYDEFLRWVEQGGKTMTIEEKKVRMCATCKHYRPTEGRCSLGGEPRSPIFDCDRFDNWHEEEEPEGWEQMSLI